MHKGTNAGRNRLEGTLWFFLLSAVCSSALTHQSFWIDEAFTGCKAMQPDLGSWWSEMVREKGSDLQMPFFMFYIWCFAKVCGTSEWALRAGGLLWLLPGLLACVMLFQNWRNQLAVFLTIITSAFVWSYANEARPYAMQLGLSGVILAAVWKLRQYTFSGWQERLVLAVIAICFLLLAASSMLGVIWDIALFGSICVLFSRSRLVSLVRAHSLLMGGSVVLLGALGCYYLWTLSLGARATNVSRTDLQTVAFIFYEHFGFSGLGPGRTELRQYGIRTLYPYLPLLLLYAGCVLAVLAVGLRQIFVQLGTRRGLMLVGFNLVPLVLLVGLGLLTHFRVLGRHCAPLMPIWFIILGLGVIELWRGQRWWARAVVPLFLLLAFTSCMLLRFSERHLRDDFRSAALTANQALKAGKTVWWNAALSGARYYGVPLIESRSQSSPCAIAAVELDANALARLPSPQMIVASKPDIYDPTGALAAFIRAGGYRQTAKFPSFTVWER